MRMRFIGKNSMGYINGHIYNVEIQSDNVFVLLSCKGHMTCPYGSLKALLKNWEEL